MSGIILPGQDKKPQQPASSGLEVAGGFVEKEDRQTRRTASRCAIAPRPRKHLSLLPRRNVPNRVAASTPKILCSRRRAHRCNAQAGTPYTVPNVPRHRLQCRSRIAPAAALRADQLCPVSKLRHRADPSRHRYLSIRQNTSGSAHLLPPKPASAMRNAKR